MMREILAFLARKETLHKFIWQGGERASSGRRGHALSLGTLRTILLLLSIKSVLQEAFQLSAHTRLTLGCKTCSTEKYSPEEAVSCWAWQ